MALYLFSGFLILCMATMVSSRNKIYIPPNVSHLTDLFYHVSIVNGFAKSFGASNIELINNGSYATLSLNKSTGSGLASLNKYYYGFFSAAIKLPSGLSSGVVVAFYLSNADYYPHNHDEIDIELLGNDRKNNWVLQTNIYANGSVNTGREEKFYLWFDPTEEHHQYSILWNNHHIVFLVDNLPVREFPHKGALYPSKPMLVYATIWDGSEWATGGGKYPVNYKYAPFVVSMTEVEMVGCISDPISPIPSCSEAGLSRSNPVEGEEFIKLSDQQITAMDWARRKLMFYSYCKDTSRYKVLPSECH